MSLVVKTVETLSDGTVKVNFDGVEDALFLTEGCYFMCEDGTLKNPEDVSSGDLCKTAD